MDDIKVQTPYGDARVEVLDTAEPGDMLYRGARVTASRLDIGDDVIYYASANFTEQGEVVPRGRGIIEDVDSLNIWYTPKSDQPHTHRYVTGAKRDRLVKILAQAYAEATYTKNFDIAQVETLSYNLASLLSDRTHINRKIRQTLKDLKQMGVVRRGVDERSMPQWFTGGEQHRMEFEGAVELMAKHVKIFVLTDEQTEIIEKYGNGCDQGSWIAVDAVHRQVCPLLQVEVR